MIIPIEMLDQKTLHALIEEFVSRDGTDFTDMEEKIESIKSQLNQKKIVISFDQDSKTCHIISTDDLTAIENDFQSC